MNYTLWPYTWTWYCGLWITHLDESYSSSEIFPTGYNIYRKIEQMGRGVFLGIKNRLVSIEESTLDTNAELIWAKINFHNSPPLYICSFYWPPHSDLQPILEINESIDKLNWKHQNCDFILAGDFNLPSIEWSDSQGTILRSRILPTLVSSGQSDQYPLKSDHYPLNSDQYNSYIYHEFMCNIP